MKRVILCGAILIIIAGMSVLSLFILNRTINSLYDCTGRTQQLYDHGDTQAAYDEAVLLYEEWRSSYKVLSLFIRTESLEDINAIVARIAPDISSGNDETDSELQSLQIMLERLKENESPLYYNLLVRVCLSI